MNRDQLIDRAIRERRISAAQRDEFARMYDAQPHVIEHLLTANFGEGGLMPGLAAAHETLESSAPYDPAWLNDRERAVLAARRAQAASPAAVPASPARSKRRQPPQASAAPQPSPYAPGSPYATGPAAKHPSPPPVAVPPAESDDAYDESWLTAAERSRRDAVKAGTYQPGPIQFEDDAARSGRSGGRAMSAAPEANVVLWARLYSVLADRDEYLRDDPGERIDRTAATVSPCLSEVDAALIAQATELDFVCAYAVRMLRKRASAPVLDLLGIMRPDRLAAIAYALPDDRRKAIVRRDPYWARAVAALDADVMAEVDEVANALDAIAKDMDDAIHRCLLPEVAADVIEFGQELRRLDAGVANRLTLGDLLRVADSQEALAALIEEKRREHLAAVE